LPCTADLYKYLDAGPDADGGPDLDAAPPYCVSCAKNRDSVSPGQGICTATEAVFVAIDIAQGAVAEAGPDPVGFLDGGQYASCYGCLNAAGCLDTNHKSGVECDDLGTAPFPAGNGAMSTYLAACVNALSCVTSAKGGGCAFSNQGQTYCMCGPAEEPAAPNCETNIGSANGPCLAAELSGFSYPPTDGVDLVMQFINFSAQPSGMANNLIGCSVQNGCYSTTQGSVGMGSMGVLSCFLGAADAGGK
jgi:hypothetical protein